MEYGLEEVSLDETFDLQCTSLIITCCQASKAKHVWVYVLM